MHPPIAPWRWIVALFGLSLGFGIVVGVFSEMTPGATPLALTLMAGVVAGLTLLMIWLVAMYWRRIDEAAREAHKWAWFWGGNIALVPVMAGFLVLSERSDLGVPLLPGAAATPANYVITGGLAVVFLLMVGYGVAWLGWWLWKSR